MADVNLSVFPRTIQIVDRDGRPTRQFQQWMQTFRNELIAAIDANADAIEAIQNAQDAADAANAAAAAAQGAADSLDAAQELANSLLDPAVVLSADSSGTITIASHDRVYGGTGGTVAITGDTISGFTPGDYVNVYYSDPTRAGGAVTFQGTTGTVAQEGATHTVGGVQIPATGSTDGYGYYPPGYIPPYFSY